jgi:hypothetical protein
MAWIDMVYCSCFVYSRAYRVKTTDLGYVTGLPCGDDSEEVSKVTLHTHVHAHTHTHGDYSLFTLASLADEMTRRTEIQPVLIRAGPSVGDEE